MMLMAVLTASTLFFAGDSTLDDHDFECPYRSWGRETAFSMKSGNAVENFARSGASTKSFLADGRWGNLMAKVKSGDFVLIEFGHNDQKKSTPFYLNERYAAPNGLYREIVNGHTLLGIGSEVSGGVCNVLMKDCTAGSVNRIFYLKTNRRRGGVLENIVCENIRVREAKEGVFEIGTDVLYEWTDFPDYENRLTKIRNITARNLTCEDAGWRVKIVGDPSCPVEGVRIENVTATRTRHSDVLENVIYRMEDERISIAE